MAPNAGRLECRACRRRYRDHRRSGTVALSEAIAIVRTVDALAAHSSRLGRLKATRAVLDGPAAADLLDALTAVAVALDIDVNHLVGDLAQLAA